MHSIKPLQNKSLVDRYCDSGFKLTNGIFASIIIYTLLLVLLKNS